MGACHLRTSPERQLPFCKEAQTRLLNSERGHREKGILKDERPILVIPTSIELLFEDSFPWMTSNKMWSRNYPHSSYNELLNDIAFSLLCFAVTAKTLKQYWCNTNFKKNINFIYHEITHFSSFLPHCILFKKVNVPRPQLRSKEL